MNETKHTFLYLKKYHSLILFSKGAHSLLSAWEIDGETYTLRGDFFMTHIFFLEPVGANACTPLQAASSGMTLTHLIGCVSLDRLSILTGLTA